MNILTLASRKGGAGKTTLSALLAVEAARVKAGPVAVIDVDQMAGLSQWWKVRAAEDPMLVVLEDTLRATLASLKARGFGLVVIDTPPAEAPDEALREADIVLIPVQPSPNDLRAVGVTVKSVRALKKPVVFVLNRVKNRVRLTGEAAIALSQHGTVASAMIHDRTDYAGAMTGGLTAPEITPNGPAAAEIALLWAYVSERLEEGDA